jgi:hypothetical protein
MTYEKNFSNDNYFSSDYRNEKYELEKYNKKVTGASQNKYFCVFRVGKKFKNLNMVRQYQYHVNRESNVLNADPKKTKFNRVLIGSANITKDVQDYIKDVPFIRSNANIAFDLVLTAHHEFFNELQDNEKEIWINHNIDYLKKNFGDNCINATLHADKYIVPLYGDVYRIMS